MSRLKPGESCRFVGHCGELYIQTAPQGYAYYGLGSNVRMVREDYAVHHHEITCGRELVSCLRAGPYAWPGGYPLYFVTNDGEALSFGAVRENLWQVIWSIRHKVDDGWRVVGLDIVYDDEEVFCAHTGERI